ncbi:MAG: YncE family protein [Bacteroides sp.]|nr:YncE family protein [Bacteroides sp.]
MSYGPSQEEDFDYSEGEGVFITNEGNFMYSNATLSYYNKYTQRVENKIFSRANAYALGDVAQSMVIHKGIGYIVVNNSSLVVAIHINTIKVAGQITGLVSPRYMHFLSDTKAYITDLYAGRIAIVNPRTFQVTGYVDTGIHKSTEQMVQYGNYLFTNCWSYDNTILVIDTRTDQVVDSIRTGIQPASLVIDKNNKIWALTDGGYEGSIYGHEAPSLYRIDAATRDIEQTFTFTLGDWPSEVKLNGARDTLYFINRSVWRMAVTDSRLPVRPFVEEQNTLFYGLGVDPDNSEIYVADAIDYSQPGIVYRYSPQGTPLDSIRVGITPGSFCFR